MRVLLIILALFVFNAPAVAQNWQEYTFPDYSFSVSFPAAPQIETTTYKAADDRAVEAHIYSLRRDDAEFKVTVAEIRDPGLEEKAVVDHAIKTLSEGGEVKVNIPHRVNRVFGRQLSILQGDGSRTAVALFDYNGRLYQIEGRSLPNGTNATADAIRFVQSLIFTGGGSNRSADEIRSARAACDATGGSGNAGVAGSATALDDGRRFESRCRRQQAFAALTGSLNAGDLSGAQQAWSSLGQQPRFGNPNGPFAQAMSQVGQALQNGDLHGAQRALSSLQQRGRGGDRQPRDGTP